MAGSVFLCRTNNSFNDTVSTVAASNSCCFIHWNNSHLSVDMLVIYSGYSGFPQSAKVTDGLFPRVLRAAAFAPAALSLLAARLLRKTAALITPPKSVWS
jgi:hypothetical protein